MDISWNWSNLTANEKITSEIINNNPEYPWDIGTKFMNPNILNLKTQQYVIDDNMFWKHLSVRFGRILFYNQKQWKRDLYTRIIENNINEPWDFDELSKNGEFYKLALKYPEKPWNMKGYSFYENIVRYVDTKEWFAAITIQRWWLDLYYNPKSKVCKKRLLRECDDLNNDEFIIHRNKKQKVSHAQ